MARALAGREEYVVIVLSRIDNRLVHGQVVEAWIPHLRVQRVVVVDDAAADDALGKAAMRLAMPPGVELSFVPHAQAQFAALAGDAARTLVLFREIDDAAAAQAHGLPVGVLNVGNVHARKDRTQVTRAVFLSADERLVLEGLAKAGLTVELRSVPSEAPTLL